MTWFAIKNLIDYLEPGPTPPKTYIEKFLALDHDSDRHQNLTVPWTALHPSQKFYQNPFTNC